MRLSCVLVLAISIIARRAQAEPVSTKRRAAATALAVFPGFVVHGIGAWTVGEKPAAKKLFYGEAIGIGLAGVGGLLVGGSGGNPYTTPAVPLVIAGGGLLLQSWFTDIWVAAGGSRVVEQPRTLPPWSVEVGTSWLHDAYRERALLRASGNAWFGRIGASAGTMVDAAGDATLADANVYVRIFGPPATGTRVEDNSRLTLRAGTRLHRDDGDRTTQWTQELEIRGRLDLVRIDRAFRSSFAELSTGVGAVHVGYGDVASEWSSELLGGFAWGAYLGSHGEAKLFYEHVRDGLVGGLPAYRAAGFVGYVGASANVIVWGPWEVRGELAIGNAYLTTLALAYRGGTR